MDRETFRRRIETGLYVAFVLYGIALLSDLPSGDARLVPVIVVPIFLGLLCHRLLFDHVDGYRTRVEAILESLSGDGGMLEQYEQFDEAESADELESVRTTITSIGWICGGFLSTYLLGAFLGGYVFLFCYLFVRHTRRSAIVLPPVFLLVLYGMQVLLGIRVWTGVIL
jgi:hypothetical protein